MTVQEKTDQIELDRKQKTELKLANEKLQDEIARLNIELEQLQAAQLAQKEAMETNLEEAKKRLEPDVAQLKTEVALLQEEHSACNSDKEDLLNQLRTAARDYAACAAQREDLEMQMRAALDARHREPEGLMHELFFFKNWFLTAAMFLELHYDAGEKIHLKIAKWS